MDAVRAEGLTKTFTKSTGLWRKRQAARTVTAVSNLSFRLAKGEFVGFLGPNGAGKSTTIKMLTGILHPTSGEVTVAGLSPHHHRTILAKRIGVVFGQRTQLWWDLPLRESFRILRAMYGVPEDEHRARLLRLDDWLGFGSFLSTPVRQLSLGQRMRGELAGALLHQPEVLFLDEPTIGLDVSAKASIREFLREYNRETKATIILTTHDMGDIEQLCSRIVMIQGGEARFDGPTAELHARVGVPSALVVRFEGAVNKDEFQGMDGVLCTVSDEPNTIVAEFNRVAHSAVSVLEWLSRRTEVAVVDFALREPSLEAVMERVYQQSTGSQSRWESAHDGRQGDDHSVR